MIGDPQPEQRSWSAILLTLSVPWIALAAEMAWTVRLPHGCLLLPVSCGVIFWRRSLSGILTAGLFLLLDWIVRPTVLPLCPMILPLIAAWALSPSWNCRNHFSGRSFLRVPGALHLPLLTMAAMLLHVAGRLQANEFLSPAHLMTFAAAHLESLAAVAVPLSGGLGLFIWMADELGLRRSVTTEC